MCLATRHGEALTGKGRSRILQRRIQRQHSTSDHFVPTGGLYNVVVPHDSGHALFEGFCMITH
jgi:hypothetical protein